MSKLDFQCLDCRRITCFIEKEKNAIAKASLRCPFCQSRSLNLVSYYKSAELELTDAQKRLNALQAKIEELEAAAADMEDCNEDEIPPSTFWH